MESFSQQKLLWPLQEIAKYKIALKKFFKTQGKAVVFFERNFKSSHTQVQSVAIPLEKADHCMSVFMSNAEQLKVDLVEIPERSELKEIVPAGQSPNFLTPSKC